MFVKEKDFYCLNKLVDGILRCDIIYLVGFLTQDVDALEKFIRYINPNSIIRIYDEENFYSNSSCYIINSGNSLLPVSNNREINKKSNSFVVSDYLLDSLKKEFGILNPREMFFELIISEHCDLNCSMCDHFSPIAEPAFLNVGECEHDLSVLSRLTNGNIGGIYLIGGEPLLNGHLVEIIKIVRNYFCSADVFLYTNGLKLFEWENKKENLWLICKKYNITIEVTRYPINLDYEKIQSLSKKYGVSLNIFTNAVNRLYNGKKILVKHKLDLNGGQLNHNYMLCRQRKRCYVISEGKLFLCPTIASISHFNKYFNKDLNVTPKDYVKLSEIEDINDFIKKANAKPDFCRYCQLNRRTMHKWSVSQKNIEEWT